MKGVAKGYKGRKVIGESDKLDLISCALRDIVDTFKGTSMVYDVGTREDPTTTVRFPDDGIILKLGYGDGQVTATYEISMQETGGSIVNKLNAILKLSKDLVQYRKPR